MIIGSLNFKYFIIIVSESSDSAQINNEARWRQAGNAKQRLMRRSQRYNGKDDPE